MSGFEQGVAHVHPKLAATCCCRWICSSEATGQPLSPPTPPPRPPTTPTYAPNNAPTQATDPPTQATCSALHTFATHGCHPHSLPHLSACNQARGDLSPC
eukprot:366069-Chlamydomonas_euryale.AAC.10